MKKTLRSKYLAIFVIVLLTAHAPLFSQTVYGPNDTIVVYATLYNDSIWVPTAVLPNATCIGKFPRHVREKIRQWTRLRNAVYVTYPYAKEAGRVINEINVSLAGIEGKDERKKIIKQREKDLKKAFSDKITNLSVYQGKVLMKLINRQTGSDCYEILKEYKGGANARFWQTVAFIFGSSLKQSYEPRGADKEIEGITQEVEMLYMGYPGMLRPNS